MWTCQRQTNGVVCKHKNAGRARKCARCQKPRPARRRPAHMDALKIPYEQYIVINGGKEECGICGKPPPDNRRLDRDHDHVTGKPRGLLCRRCNRLLTRHLTIQWIFKAIFYLQRTIGPDKT